MQTVADLFRCTIVINFMACISKTLPQSIGQGQSIVEVLYLRGRYVPLIAASDPPRHILGCPVVEKLVFNSIILVDSGSNSEMVTHTRARTLAIIPTSSHITPIHTHPCVRSQSHI